MGRAAQGGKRRVSGVDAGQLFEEISKIRLPASAPVALVVEDDPDAAILAEGMLRSLGYRSVVVNDGNDALTALLDGAPALLLFDVCLPLLGGDELARLVRGPLKMHNVPMVAASAVYPQQSPVGRKIASYGVVSYLVKPFTMNGLRSAIDEAKTAAMGYGKHDGPRMTVIERNRRTALVPERLGAAPPEPPAFLADMDVTGDFPVFFDDEDDDVEEVDEVAAEPAASGDGGMGFGAMAGDAATSGFDFGGEQSSDDMLADSGQQPFLDDPNGETRTQHVRNPSAESLEVMAARLRGRIADEEVTFLLDSCSETWLTLLSGQGPAQVGTSLRLTMELRFDESEEGRRMLRLIGEVVASDLIPLGYRTRLKLEAATPEDLWRQYVALSRH